MQCAFQITESRQVLSIVGPVSLRSALARYADLWAPARKACFPALAASASDEKEAARLRHLASPEGKAEFSDWVGGPRRSLLEVMLAFPSCKPSLGVATTQQYADDSHTCRISIS